MLAGVAGTGLVEALATAGIPSPKMKQSPARSGARHRLMGGGFDEARAPPPRIGRRPNVIDLAKPNPMARHAGMSPQARRAWGIGAIAVFLLLCGGIAISQWYAVHVNVPHYQALNEKQKH